MTRAIAVQRVTSADDFAQFGELLTEYERALPPPLRHGSVPDADELARTHQGPEAAFLGWASSAAVGCVALRRKDAQTAILMRLYVKPQSRGLGAARALVEATIAFALEQSYERIVLDTNRAELPAAYALYLSMGFSDCEAFTDVSYPCPTFMELRLATSGAR